VSRVETKVERHKETGQNIYDEITEQLRTSRAKEWTDQKPK
jgi:hypothetical protein